MNTIDINDRNVVFLARVIAKLSDVDKITFKQLPKPILDELSANMSSPDAAASLFNTGLDIMTFTYSFLGAMRPYFVDKKIVPQMMGLFCDMRKNIVAISPDERLGVYYVLDLFFLAKDALHCGSFNVAALKSYFSSQLSGYFEIASQILIERALMRDAECIEDIYAIILASGLSPITIVAANTLETSATVAEYHDSYVRVEYDNKCEYKSYSSLISGDPLGSYDYIFDVVCQNRSNDLSVMSKLLLVNKAAHDSVLKHIKRESVIEIESNNCVLHCKDNCELCFSPLDYSHWNAALDIFGSGQIERGFGFHKRWIDFDPIKYNSCLHMVRRMQCDGWFLTLHCIEHIGMNAFQQQDGDKALLLERMMIKIIARLKNVSFNGTRNFLGDCSLYSADKNVKQRIEVHVPYKGSLRMFLEDVRKYSFLKMRSEPHYSVMSSVLQHSNYMSVERPNSPLDSAYIIDSLPGYKCVVSNSGIIVCSPDSTKERMRVEELHCYRGSPYDGFLDVSGLLLTLPYDRDVRELEHVDLIFRAEYRLMLSRKWYYK